MNEMTGSLDMTEAQISKLNFTSIQSKVLQCANISSVPSGLGNATTYR